MVRKGEALAAVAALAVGLFAASVSAQADAVDPFTLTFTSGLKPVGDGNVYPAQLTPPEGERMTSTGPAHGSRC